MVISCDVCVLGAGHNGLTAAVFLARAGLRVRVLERSSVLGGAARTERPFAKAPEPVSYTHLTLPTMRTV